MAVPTRLADSLRRALGDDAAEDLVNRLEEGDDRRADFLQLRADLAEFRETMRADAAAFRETVRADLAVFRADLAEFRQDVAARFAATDKKVDAVESSLRLEIRDTRIDVIKWSFVFWITTLGTLLLGRLLR